MELFKGSNIDFIANRKWFYAFSLTMFIIGIGALVVRKGPRLGIDFTGGTLIQVKFKELPAVDKIRHSLNEGGFQGYSLQTQPENASIIVRLKDSGEGNAISAQIINALKKQFPGIVNDIPDRVEFVGPVIGRSLILNAFISIFGSLGLIVLYVAYRFKNWVWGTVGVLALAHDVFLTFSLLVVLNREITLVIIAAFLTLAGYSINDTIVIFDRVRENLRLSRKEDRKALYNRSVNETIGRTINTSMTALIAACSLFFAGEVLRDFALAMAFGLVIGTYSTFACVTIIDHWQSRSRPN